MQRVDLRRDRRRAAAPGPALRSGLYHLDPSARAHSPRDAGRQRSARVRNAPEKLFVMDFPELMPPTLITRDRAAIEAFRAEHGEVVMKPLLRPWRRRRVKVSLQRPQFRLAVRSVQRDLPRALGGPEIPAAGRRRRQAHHSGRRAGARRGQSRAGGDDIRSNMVRGGAAEADRTDARASGRSARASGRS